MNVVHRLHPSPNLTIITRRGLLDTERALIVVIELTTLAKLNDDERRLGELQNTFSGKLRNLEWLSRRAVVAPLSNEVVSAEQGLTSTSVALDDLKIQAKQALTTFQQIKLDVESEQLDRTFVIDDLKRQIRVSEAKLAFDGTITAQRDGRVLDLQVIPGQTVGTGQRLGTMLNFSYTVNGQTLNFSSPDPEEKNKGSHN